MSKLSELSERIVRLPELETQKINSSKYSALQKTIDTDYNGLCLIQGYCDCLDIVFPGVKLPESGKALRDSPKAARNLLEKLKSDATLIGNTDTNNKIIRFGERNDVATKELKKKWKALVTESLKPLKPLVNVASDADLAGYEDMDKGLNSLEMATEQLPTSSAKAEEYKNQLEKLADEVASLELEGPGGTFLMKAVAGKANPKDLLKEEVREYLDEKKLWHILVVCTKR